VTNFIEKKYKLMSSGTRLLTGWMMIAAMISCGRHSGPDETNKGSGIKPDFYAEINFRFSQLDTTSLVAFDSIEAANKRIELTIEKYKDSILLLRDFSDYDMLYISRSADKNLCLLSWDTRMGGTNIEFATMAIYKTAKVVRTKMLIDSSEKDAKNTFIHYDAVYTLSASTGNIYLADGFGQGSTALPWEEVRAFKILEDELTNPAIFPESQYRLLAEFDTHEFAYGERIPTIKFEEEGRTVLFPLANEKGGFTGKYQSLILKDNIYQTQ
jgi:hypothetical protein